jgi:adenosylmethionine-8-amino-7-oxononanoate aminotransferase
MTDMVGFESSGLVIERGDGNWVVDTLGRRFFSGAAGLWNVSLGYGHPRLIEAITEQLHTLSYGSLFRYGHVVAEELAVRLLDLCPPGMGRVLFTTSGSGAVDAAVMGARRFQQLRGSTRDLVVSLEGSYHGTTGAAIAVTGDDLDQAGYGIDTRTSYRKVSIGAENHPFEGRDGDPYDGAGALRALFEREGSRVAAVVVEPVMGSSCTVLPAAFVEELRRQRDEHDFVLVVDEVATGFGRTGTMLATEWIGLEPDVLVLSKQINSGYLPLAATVFSDEIAEAFDAVRAPMLRGETQGGNPAACAAALATLDVYEELDLLTHVGAVAEALEHGLDDLPVNHRGVGLMRALDLDDMPGTVSRALGRGLIVHPSRHGVCLMPPLTMTHDEVDFVLETLAAVLRP